MNANQDREDFFSASPGKNSLLQKILDTTQTKIFWKDAQRRFLGANRAFLEYYGFASLSAIVGKTDEEMGWHDAPDPFKNDEIMVLQKGISTVRVHGKCLLHGQERDIVASKSPVYQDGKIVGLVGSFDDVTEEYRQKNEIGRLNQTLDSLPAGIAVLKPWRNTYICISVNDYFLHMIGSTKENFVEKTIENFLLDMHPEDKGRLVAAIHDFNGGQTKLSGTYRYLNYTTGEYVWLFTEWHKVRHPNDEEFIYCSYTNVDEVKKAQVAEENLRRQYESSVEAAKLFLWVYDVRTRVVTMEKNPYTVQCCQHMGMPMVLQNAPEALLPFADEASKQKLRQIYQNIEDGAAYSCCEISYHLPASPLAKYLHVSLTAAFDEKGKPFKAYGVSRDITEEKLAQQQYEHEVAYIHATDKKEFIAKAHNDLTANKMLEYIRITKDAAQLDKQISYDDGCKIFEQLPTLLSDKEAYARIFNRQALLKGYRDGVREFNFECRRNHNMHAITWVNTEVRLCLNPANKHVESFMYSYDVTDKYLRRQLMTNLKELGYKYLGMINVRLHSATFYGMDNKFDRWSVWLETADYDKDCAQIIRETVSDEEQDRVIAATSLKTIIKKLKEGGEYTYAYNRIGVLGKIRHILLQYRYLDAEKNDIFFCATDNTEGYLEEQEQIARLKKAMLDAARANDAKSAFLSSISHDMRTPLNGILGFTDLALHTADNDKKQEYLAKIATSGQLMLNLVNDVLDLSKIESGKMELKKEVFPIADFVNSIVVSVQQNAKAKDITLTSDVQTGDFVYIREDRTRLQQIVLNILSNAIKYTPKHGQIKFTLKNHSVDEQGYNTLIIFTDNGIGMSSEYLPHIFEPFSQEHAKEADGVEGTGLGMSIVKRIVDLMGGTIEVQSTKGKGTTFTVRLFVEKVAGPIVTQLKTQDQDNEILRGKRIMLCEDNRLNAEIVQTLLRSQGMQVELAINGQIAIDDFTSHAPGYYDAIIMDIRMPVLDGLEATKAIRALDREDAETIPIIAHSADVFSEEVEKFLSAGMNNYLAKPVDKNKLYEVLREEIGKKQDK